MKKHIFIAIFTLLLLATAGANNYIYGEGQGKSYDEAFADAQAKIAQQISVRVESVTELNALDIEEDAKHSYRESIERNIKLTVDESLNGIEVISKKVKKKVHEVKLGLDKTKYLASLRSELDEKKNAARNLVDNAEEFVSQGKPLFAIDSYTDAQSYLPELYAKKAFYDSLSDHPYFIWHELNVGTIDAALRDLIGRVSFELVSGGDQIAEQGVRLQEPVVFFVYYASPDGGRIPLSGYPVHISYGDGSSLESGQSDDGGYYRAVARAMELEGMKKIVIRSKARDLPTHLARLSQSRFAEAFYEIMEVGKTELSLNIKGQWGARDERLENIVARALSGSAFNVSPYAGYVLEGRIAEDDVKALDGFAGSSYIANVRLELFLVRKSDGKKLGSFSAKGTGNAKSESDAILQAVNKIRIDSRKLNSSLQDFLRRQ